jgi:hypothetical protein
MPVVREIRHSPTDILSVHFLEQRIEGLIPRQSWYLKVPKTGGSAFVYTVQDQSCPLVRPC